ncbi:MAG: DUF3014 domain-containing protein [Candidatus Reddybacter sp.]
MPLAPNDPLTGDARHPTSPSKTRLGLLIIAFSLLGATIFFLYTNQLSTNQDHSAELVVPIEQEFMQEPTPINLDSPPTIKIPPLFFEAEFSKPSKSPLPPLPVYDEANGFITEQLGSEYWQALNINPQIIPALNKAFLLQRSVAFLDGLAKGALLDKLQPFARPSQAFIADKQGQTLSMGSANFRRYDVLIQGIVAIDTQQAATFFHWTRPLLETAYSELGYPAEHLGGGLIAAIDTLLATPIVEGPIVLKSESVLYQYADPSIEALPGAQKQLIRMGTKNGTLLKSWLRELRSALLAPD